MTIIRSVDELRAIYGEAKETSYTKVTKALTPGYRRMIEASPFMALATAGPEGLDCSPRGDKGGIIRVVDDKTLMLPDWHGNKRVDSLTNIVRDPRVALLFLVPGSNTTMRVNGKAEVSIDPDLLHRFEMDGKHPRTVVIFTIDEVYFQCARALLRSELWNPDNFVDPASLPTPGALVKDAKADFDQETYDREWPKIAEKTLW